jgi:hypothetical protein
VNEKKLADIIEKSFLTIGGRKLAGEVLGRGENSDKTKRSAS